MLDFNPISLSDISWIKPIVINEDIKNADYSFSNIFAWSDVFNVQAALIDGCLVIKSICAGKLSYSYPIGTKAPDIIHSVLNKLIGYSKELGEEFVIQAIAPEKLDQLETWYPGLFEIIPETDYFDYIYSAEKLCTLAGKKLHAKRNYINRFITGNNWSFEPVDTNNIEECISVYNSWVANKLADTEAIDDEIIALLKSLDNFKALELDGGLLRVSGDVCAFAIGEKLSRDTYVVHFEKAVQAMTGAYPMINREFARFIVEKYPDIKYINREDDMGLENLRKAKKSYYPEFMVEKYMAVMK